MSLDVISYSEAKKTKKSVVAYASGIISYHIDQANNKLVMGTQNGQQLEYQFQQPLPGKDGRDGIDGQPGSPGNNGSDGFSPRITVKTNTSTTYVLTITTKDGSFDTPNLKGAKGEDGQTGAAGSGGKFDVNSLTRSDIIKLRELLNISGDLPDIEEPATTYVSFEMPADAGQIDDDNLYLNFEGDEPNMTIEDDGNLYLEYEGAEPSMFIDEDGNMIIEE